MAKKRNTRPHFVAVHTAEDSQGRLQVMLPKRVRQNKRLMCWLHHRVVDLLADSGALSYLDDDLNERLSLLSVDITSDYIQNLVVAGRAAVEKELAEEEENDGESGAADAEQDNAAADGNGRPDRKAVCHGLQRRQD